MTISFLNTSISRAGGGLFEVARQLAQCLALESTVKVHVLGSEDPATYLDLPSWEPLQPRCFVPIGPRAYGYSPAFWRALEEINPDLAHVHGLWTYPSLAAWQWSRRSFCPYLITIHGMLDCWALRNSSWKKRMAAYLFANGALREAACLHVLNRAELASVRDYGLTNPVCLIPNGVTLPDKAPKAQPVWAHRIQSGSKVLLYLGRLHPKKGLSNLLSAWGKVRSRSRTGAGHWHLAIAGWDQNRHEAHLRALTLTLGISDSVHFLGPQFGESKAAAYHQADAFVLPSHSEGLPMVVLEAWAHGLPVLMTPQCNLPEGFDSSAALPIDPNEDSIAEGLRHLFGLTDAERQTMGGRGQALVAEQFTWSNVAAQLREVYEWVLDRGAKPSCVFAQCSDDAAGQMAVISPRAPQTNYPE